MGPGTIRARPRASDRHRPRARSHARKHDRPQPPQLPCAAMKTLCVMDWVSRTNGGIFEAERRLQQQLRTKMGIGVEVVGLRDAKTDADLPAWSPLVPTSCAVRGPAALGYAP